MKFKLVKNSGYKWIKSGDVWFKGYFSFLDNPEQIFREGEAAQVFNGVSTFDEFIKLLKKIEGIYCVIVEKSGVVYASVDRARSMPIYFSSNGEYISDSAEQVKKMLGNRATVDQEKYMVLHAANYIMGNETIYTEIKQLDMGEVCEIKDGEIKIEKYFYHLSDIEQTSDEVDIERLDKAAINVFHRIKAAIAGRPVVLSMSGGYDSRFVGCMLKRVGIEDVLCYTYGKPNSYEVIQSKKNAQALGYKWLCVEYTDKEVLESIGSTGMDYLEINNNHDFTAYVQNFPAVKKMHSEGWIKPNSVFITGLCGDMPSGSYIREEIKGKEYNSASAARELYKLVFARNPLIKDEADKQITYLKNELEKIPIKIDDYQSYVSAIDAIYTGACHSRVFLHMNDVHDYFGYEWLLPFWDSELLEVWYSIPAQKRIGQKLYSKWLLECLCKPYGIDQKKTVVSYSKNRFANKILHLVGGTINFVLLNLGIPFRRKYDFNNFGPLELEVFKRLKSRKWVVYKKAGLTHLLNCFIMQERYDLSYMKQSAKKLLK